MPYINVNTSISLSPAQKEKIKTDLGKFIAILPGKNEGGLMVAFQDGRDMYHAGSSDAPCAFIEIRLFHESPMDAKKEFIATLAKYFEENYGIPVGRDYMNILEFKNWGTRGEYKE